MNTYAEACQLSAEVTGILTKLRYSPEHNEGHASMAAIALADLERLKAFLSAPEPVRLCDLPVGSGFRFLNYLPSADYVKTCESTYRDAYGSGSTLSKEEEFEFVQPVL